MLLCVEGQPIACSDSRTSVWHHWCPIYPVAFPWCSWPPLELPLFPLFSRPLRFDPERVSLRPMLLAFLVVTSTDHWVSGINSHKPWNIWFLLQRIPVLCQFYRKPPIGVCNYVHNCVLVWILYISSTVTNALLIIGRISFASSSVNHVHSPSF